jgi:hypothetical protein
MASLSTKIKLYLAANSVNSVDFTSDVLLQDDMVGGVSNPYIKEWNISGVAKPTDEQLAVHETAGNTAESNAQVDSTRRAAYGDIGEQLDEIYHDIDAWRTRIQGIKTANPKS